jgi:hypothetical protein
MAGGMTLICNENKHILAHMLKCQSLQNAMADIAPKTPTKIYSRKGRKPKEASVDDYCRACKCSLKNKYGSLGSFVNVFANRAEFRGLVVASVCEQSGLQLKEISSSSTRICPSCSRKIKTFIDLYTFLSSEMNKPGSETGI